MQLTMQPTDLTDIVRVAIFCTVGLYGIVHCVQKKTLTHIFFHISMSDV